MGGSDIEYMGIPNKTVNEIFGAGRIMCGLKSIQSVFPDILNREHSTCNIWIKPFWGEDSVIG